ncbi:DoxX family protein [Planctomycetota bacterium]
MSNIMGLLRRSENSGWPQLLARLVFGAVMIYFALPKIAEPLDFLKEIRNYHILPEDPAILLNLVAVCLPWFELIGSLALILGLARRGVGVLFTVLMIAFTAMVLYRATVIHGDIGGAFCDIKFDCGCGRGEVYICHKVLENLGLLLLAAYCFLSRSNKLSLATLWKHKTD